MRFGVLPSVWSSHGDIRQKERKGNKIRKRREGDERVTGTLVDPQTGELASGYPDLNNRVEI